MDVENVPWTSLRPGDIIATIHGHSARVAGVMLNGEVWDVNGDMWLTQHPDGLVTRLRPVSRFAQDLDVMERYDESHRDINIEVR